MELLGDFLQKLGPDVSVHVLSFLDDPADFVRASSVSRSWRQFVIENEFCKTLCLKLFPEVSNVVHAIEVDSVIQHGKADSNGSKVLETAESNHNVYAFLARGLSPVLRNNCISEAICASTTDNYPEESIRNTLDPRDKVEEKASYWSSTGQSDASYPEKLTYRLIPDLCFVTEINIQPFQAYFQYGFPIYSARAVRFRMGYPNHDDILESLNMNDRYEWAYVSPVFPMAQENCLQKFKLPEPVLSIGGILEIELLGRVQRQEMDDLFYICVAHVEVVGRTLLPGFRVKLTDSGKCTVDYYPAHADAAVSEPSLEEDSGASSQSGTITARLMRGAGRSWERVFLNTLLGNVVLIDSDDEDYSDEEMIESP